MAMSDKPPAKDSGDEEQPSSAVQQEDPHEGGSSPDSSSSSCSPPSSATVSAREGAAAGADSSPASIERGAPTKTHEPQRQPGTYDSGGTPALSYFAPTGAGKLTFLPPAGVCSQTNLRIHPCVGLNSSGESVRYFTPTGERIVEQSAPWSKAASAAEPLQQGQAGDFGLTYYTAIPGSYGTRVKGPASCERFAVQQPFAAASAGYTPASSRASLHKEQQPARPPVLPANFVRPSPCFEYPAAVTPQQLVSAAGSRGAVPEPWFPPQQGYAGAASALDTRRLQQQQQGQAVDIRPDTQKQGPSTSTPVTFFVGTPRQSQHYMESSVYPDMKSPQPYAAVPLVLSEKHRSAAGAIIRQQEMEALQPYRVQGGFQVLRRHDLGGSSTHRHGQHWIEQSPGLRLSRGGHEGGTRRRRRGLWDCYEEFMSPRDLLPMLPVSRTRLSRSLREKLHKRRREFSHVLQRIQDGVSRYYQQLTQNIMDSYPRSSRYTPEYAKQQSSGGGELSKASPEGRFVSPRFVQSTTPYAVIQQHAGSDGAKELMKGREAAQLLGRDDRVLYGEPGPPPKLLYADAAAHAVAEGVQDGYILQPAWQLPRREGVLDIVPLSSNRGTDGKYYSASNSMLSTRACPTCGGSQVLVLADPATARATAKETELGDGALQRLSEGDFDGCLQRLGEWRCTLCSDVAEAADEELLHTGGVVQQGGEWVDQMVALLVRGFAETMRSFLLMVPRPSPQVVEGYPLYEPDYTYLTRKGRPTSLTGNLWIDQLNAFLDACLVDDDDLRSPLPKPPPVPATTRTGHWLIDAANAALDKLSAEEPPPPPPSYKGFCPPAEALLPACCRSTPLLPPRPPPRQTNLCPFLDICRSTTPVPGAECPQCHQPLRSGVCPVQPPRERKLKGLFDECLSPRKQAAAQPPPPVYAYEAAPVGYYVPTGPKQPDTEYYTPAYSSSPPSAALGKQTHGRVYCTPTAPSAEAQAKMSEWVGRATPPDAFSRAEAAATCQYPYAPIYATQPCSEGFTVDAGMRPSVQPRA